MIFGALVVAVFFSAASVAMAQAPGNPPPYYAIKGTRIVPVSGPVIEGGTVAIATFGYEFARTLPYEAGNTVAYGMPWEEALKAITLYPAQILGLDKLLGTIEPGKIADIIVTNGDPMELKTEVRYLFINGKQTSLDNKHKQLWEKYKARP